MSASTAGRGAQLEPEQTPIADAHESVQNPAQITRGPLIVPASLTSAGWLVRLFGLFCVVAAFATSGADAAGRFDGRWAIYIYAPPGPCQFGYRLPLSIDGETVLYKGREVSSAAISVNAVGAVEIRLGKGQFTVIGTGALKNGGKGEGKWVAPSFQCKGSWYARRL